METVYALHDFVGENEDEISFYIGEPISVIEKDELYNDGWWQGRSVRGDTGLFPSNYVSVEKPLPVAHDDDDDDDDTDLDIPPPTAFLNGHESIYCDSTMSPVFPDVKVPSIPDIHIDTRIQQSVSEQQRISITESSLRPSVDSTESYSQLASPDLAFPAPPADLSNGNKRNETIRRPEVDSWHISGWSPAQDNLEPIPELPSQYRKGLNQNANTTATTSPSKADITKALPNSPPISSSPVKLLHAERTSSAPPSNEQISTVKANVMPSSAVNVGSPGHSRTVSQPIISTASSSSSSSPAMVAKRASVTRASLELRNSSVEINAPQPHLPLPQPLTSFRQSPDSTVSAQSTPEEEESNRRYHASSRTSVASDSHSKMANPSITSPVTSSIDVTAETRHKQPTMAEATIEGQHINEQHNEPQLQSVEDDPSSWNMQQVSNWLESVGLSSVIPEFQKHEITGDVLLDLNITMLKELDISSFGRRYHIMQAIATLRSGGNGIPTTPSDSGSASRSGRLNNAPSHSQLDNVLTDSRASIRSASSNHSQQALSRGSSTRQELYDNMNAATASNSFSHRRAPPSSVVPPRRSPSRPLSTMSFGSDAPLAAAVYSAGLEGSFPSSPPRADNQLSPVRESQDMSRMSNDNNNNYRDTLPRGSNGYQIQQQQQQQQQQHHLHHQRTPSMPIVWNSNEPFQPSRSEPASRKPSISRTATPATALPAMSTLARPMHYQQAAPEIASLARQSGVPRPEHQGWLRRQTLGPVKVWKRRWFILKDGQLFSSKTPSAERIKPVVSIAGCRITPDPNANPGYYGFRITPSNKHPDRRVQLFCYDDEDATKAWIKCLMKATIGRDFNAPVVSSCTVATVPLNVARDMAPRPPSAVFSGSPVSPVSPQQPNADNWGLPNINSEPFAGGNAEGDWPQTVGNQMVSPPLSKPVSASSISPQEQVFNTGMYPHQQTAYEQPGLRGRPVSATNDAPVGQRVSGFMRSNQEGGEDKRQSKPRISVMSRLSRAIDDSTGRRPNSRSGGQSITVLTRQSHLSSTGNNNNSSGQERISLARQQRQPHSSLVMMAGVPEEPERNRNILVPKLLDWVNRYLAHAGYHAGDLTGDLRSGFLILRFVEELSGHKLTAVIPDACETGRHVDDMSTVFHFLHSLNVDTKDFTTADILIGNEEKVVSMLLSIQRAFPSSVPADFYQ